MNTLMLKQPSPTTHGFSPSPSSLMSKKDGHFSSTSPSSSSDSINEDNLSTKEIRKTKNYSINSLLCSDKNCHKSLSPELDDDNSSEDIKNDNNQITENATIENRLNSSKKENEAVVASPSFLPQLAPFLLQFPTTALQMPGISANSIPNISGVDPISLSNLAASMASAGNGAEAQSQQFQNMYLTYMNLMNQFAGSQLATSPLRLISPATLPTMPDSSRTQPTQHPQSNVLNPFGFLSQLPQHVMTSNGLTTSLANNVFHQNDAFQHHNNHLQLSPNSLLLNKKQSRPTFTGHQIFMLEKKFEQTKYLAGSDRAQLAQELNMSESQVKVWFQNRRTKWRKKEAADNAIIRKENGTRASESPMNRADSQSPMEQIEALESTNPLLVATCNGNLIV